MRWLSAYRVWWRSYRTPLMLFIIFGMTLSGALSLVRGDQWWHVVIPFMSALVFVITFVRRHPV